jgi:hypothetical protein
MEFNGDTLTIPTPDGIVMVKVNGDGTAIVYRDGNVCGQISTDAAPTDPAAWPV